MNDLRIHWQGRPHCTPNICVASNSLSSANLDCSHTAAEEVTRLPLSTSLQIIRSRQQVLSRKHRPSSRSAGLRARQWKGSSSRSFNTQKSEYLPRLRHPSSISLFSFHSKLVIAAHSLGRPNPTTAYIDGASYSSPRQRQQHISKASAVRKQNQFNGQPLSATTIRHRRTLRHSIPTSLSHPLRLHRIYRGDQSIKRGNSYDPRVSRFCPVKPGVSRILRRSCVPSSNSRSRPLLLARERRDFSSDEGPVQFMEASPGNREALFKVPANSKLSISISRSPSERRALKRFTKELERHLRATRDLPQHPESSPSTTTVSAHTIKELEPYSAEFKAAGLAVTSDEQRGMAFGRSKKRVKEIPAPQSSSKGVQYNHERQTRRQEKTQRGKSPSHGSGSTGTTVLGFTPPHEKVVEQTRLPIPRKHSLRKDIDTRALSASPGQMTRKSLPWLRNAHQPQPAELNCVMSTQKSSATRDEVVCGTEGSATSFDSLYIKSELQSVASDKPVAAPNLSTPSKAAFSTITKGSFRKVAIPVTNISEIGTRGRHIRDEISWPEGESSRSSALNPSKHAHDPGDDEPPRLARDKVVRPVDPVEIPPTAVESKRKLAVTLPDSPLGLSNAEPTSDKLLDFDEGRTSSLGPRQESVNESTSAPQNRPSYIRRSMSFDKKPQPVGAVECLSVLQSIEFPSSSSPIYTSDTINPVRPNSPSVRCQQCFPSRLVSTATPPLMDSKQGRATSARRALGSHSTKKRADPHKRVIPRVKSSARVLNPQSEMRRSYGIVSQGRPSARASACHHASCSRLTSTSSTLHADFTSRRIITDKSVFRGLYVATAVACDEDIDTWIEEITGFQVRKMLADLSKFDGLGVNALANVARRAAKQRRQELRKWEAQRVQRKDQSGRSVLSDNMENQSFAGEEEYVDISASDQDLETCRWDGGGKSSRSRKH